MKSIMRAALAVLCLVAPAMAQQKLNPHLQISWTGTTGSGSPSIACTSANWGEPYTDTTANVRYNCGSSGWFQVQATFTGGTVPNATTFTLAPTAPNFCAANGRYNVLCAGAKGDGTTDDTAQIQTAINYAKAHKLALYFPSVPGGCYRVTSPLNLTNSGHWRIYGDGSGRNSGDNSTSGSIICHNFTAAGPVLDFTGSYDTIIRDISILPYQFNWANSAATAGVLFQASTLNNNVGDEFLEHVTVQAGNSSGSAACILSALDLSGVFHSQCAGWTASSGLVLGDGLGTATVTSPFATRSTVSPVAGPGATHLMISDSTISGQGTPLQLTGVFGYYTINDGSYITMLGNGTTNGHIIEINTPSTESGCIVGDNWRTENQTGAQSGGTSVATGLTAMYFVTSNSCMNGNFAANLETSDGGDAGKAAIGGNFRLVNSVVRMSASAAFGTTDAGANVGLVRNSKIYFNNEGSWGTLDGAFGSEFYGYGSSLLADMQWLVALPAGHAGDMVCNSSNWPGNPPGTGNYSPCLSDTVDSVGSFRNIPTNQTPTSGTISLPPQHTTSYFYSPSGTVLSGYASYGFSPSKSSTTMVAWTFCDNSTLACAYIIPGPVTVASLPACTSTIKGASMAVSDASSPTYLGTLTGGGSTYAPAVCNGTAWVAH